MRVRLTIPLVLLLCSASLGLARGENSWTGYITDSKCGAKAAHEGARDCTVKCIQAGSQYVFVNDADKKVYAIDQQDKVADHAGHHVTVKGTLAGDKLKLTSIDMAPVKNS